MLKKVLLTLAIVLMGVGIAYARDVSVSNVSTSNVNPGAGTCSITYDLSRTGPTISADQPIWVFVKYRLSTDDDFTGWQDTDDHEPSNDASDNNVDVRTDTVNANLTGDVGIVESDGSKEITWTWGDSGTSLSSDDRVRVRVYAVEMVKVRGGDYAMKDDTRAVDVLIGTTQHSASDYYLQKYSATAKMYVDFLNACANRHDPSLGLSHQHNDEPEPDFLVDSGPDAHSDDPADTDGLTTVARYPLQFYRPDQLRANQKVQGSLTMTGTIGIDAQWDIYKVIGDDKVDLMDMDRVPSDDRTDRPMVYVTWWNAYDYCAWAGLNLPEEEHWYKVAGESVGTGPAVSDFYWGNTPPTSALANFDSDIGHATDANDYEANVDSTDGGNVYDTYGLSGDTMDWADTNFYHGPTYDPTKGPTNYTDNAHRVLRGGTWIARAIDLRAAARFSCTPGASYSRYGFRCALIP